MMKIELDNFQGQLRIAAYSNNSITVASKSYNSNVIITSETVVEACLPDHAQNMTAPHVKTIIELKPEVVLFGTGKTTAFPPDEICHALYVRQIGFEVMDTGAACRSFNFLSGEGRQIVAALFITR